MFLEFNHVSTTGGVSDVLINMDFIRRISPSSSETYGCTLIEDGRIEYRVQESFETVKQMLGIP